MATKKIEWPVSDEGSKKAALKDDCFDLPEPGSAYHKVIAAQGDAVLNELVASGKIKLTPKK